MAVATDSSKTLATSLHPQPLWFELEAMLLVVLVIVAYFSRASVLPLRGEEPTRAQMAFEMVRGHDWIVPREQGEPFLIRPPAQNWGIAISCLAFGNWDTFAVRFPSLVCTLLTTLLIYGYSRTFLSRTAALAAGLAFITLPEWFQMGRQAETEAQFTFLVGASMLLWHWGIVRRWPRWLTYCVGYAFMAAAMLTKGIQAPTYFIGAVLVYLVLSPFPSQREGRGEGDALKLADHSTSPQNPHPALSRSTGRGDRVRRIFNVPHLFGVLLAMAILLAWQIPYARAVGWANVRVWLGDPAVTYNSGTGSEWHLLEIITHWFKYPVNIAIGTLPWSLLLLFFFDRNLRRWIRKPDVWPQTLWVIVCLAVALPTCLLPPGGLPRYFAPLYPCLCVLFAIVVEYIASNDSPILIKTAWRWFVGSIGCIVAVGAVAIVVISLIARHSRLVATIAEPIPAACIYAAICIGLAFIILRAGRSVSIAKIRAASLAIATFMIVIFMGLITDVRLARSEDAATAMRQLKSKLPPDQPLVSLGGHTATLFAYLYGWPIIKPEPWPTAANGLGDDLTYFCFTTNGKARPKLPFKWDEIGVVSLDRNHHDVPDRSVVLGRRE